MRTVLASFVSPLLVEGVVVDLYRSFLQERLFLLFLVLLFLLGRLFAILCFVEEEDGK